MIPSPEPIAHVVVDLGFGDAGKGLVVDALARRAVAPLIVRFNGGAQCGHNVVTPDGRHHTFAQLGAGMFVEGASTLIGPEVIVHPTGLLEELAALAAKGVPAPERRLFVSASARLITPYHQAANRLRELARGSARHGSCGLGVGEVAEDSLLHPEAVLRAGELRRASVVFDKLKAARERLWARLGEAREAPGPAADRERAIFASHELMERWQERAAAVTSWLLEDEALAEPIDRSELVLFEGAQGLWLDQDLGFHPHTTWGDTTFRAALELLGATAGRHRVQRLGVLRTHAVRHGPGPLPTEDPAAGRLVFEHNLENEWQGRVRYGWFDEVLARSAATALGGIDALALTHLDTATAMPVWRHATGWHGEFAGVQVERDARGAAVRLIPDPRASLEERAILSACVSQAQPILEDSAPEAAVIVSRIEAVVGAPAVLLARGPSAGGVELRPQP